MTFIKFFGLERICFLEDTPSFLTLCCPISLCSLSLITTSSFSSEVLFGILLKYVFNLQISQ